MQRFTSIAALTALLITGAACGSDSSSAATTAAPSTAATTAPAPETTAGAPVPSAIVSLSPTGTEMLFAIGAADQVIAVDDQSNYPAEARRSRTICRASNRTWRPSPPCIRIS